MTNPTSDGYMGGQWLPATQISDYGRGQLQGIADTEAKYKALHAVANELLHAWGSGVLTHDRKTASALLAKLEAAVSSLNTAAIAALKEAQRG